MFFQRILLKGKSQKSEEIIAFIHLIYDLFSCCFNKYSPNNLLYSFGIERSRTLKNIIIAVDPNLAYPEVPPLLSF